jgi:AraC-like DNA-binding protein
MEKVLLTYGMVDNGISYTHSICYKPTVLPIHIHDFYELYYFISGDVTMYIEGQAYKIERNEIIIMNNHELHRPVFNSEQAYERIVIIFYPEFVSKFSENGYTPLACYENKKPGFDNRIEAKTVIKLGLDKYLDSIEKYARSNTPENSLMIKTLFIQLLISLNNAFIYGHNTPESDYSCDQRISMILDYINTHLSEKITLELLEKNLFINRFYMCHIFKKNTGFSIIEYITYKRIMLAKELLASGTNVMEACGLVGFSDYSNFYKVFKKLLGKPPKCFFVRK